MLNFLLATINFDLGIPCLFRKVHKARICKYLKKKKISTFQQTILYFFTNGND